MTNLVGFLVMGELEKTALEVKLGLFPNDCDNPLDTPTRSSNVNDSDDKCDLTWLSSAVERHSKGEETPSRRMASQSSSKMDWSRIREEWSSSAEGG